METNDVSNARRSCWLLRRERQESPGQICGRLTKGIGGEALIIANDYLRGTTGYYAGGIDYSVIMMLYLFCMHLNISIITEKRSSSCSLPFALMYMWVISGY